MRLGPRLGAWRSGPRKKLDGHPLQGDDEPVKAVQIRPVEGMRSEPPRESDRIQCSIGHRERLLSSGRGEHGSARLGPRDRPRSVARPGGDHRLEHANGLRSVLPGTTGRGGAGGGYGLRGRFREPARTPTQDIAPRLGPPGRRLVTEVRRKPARPDVLLSSGQALRVPEQS